MVAATLPTISLSALRRGGQRLQFANLVSIIGSGFAANAKVQANGVFVPVASQTGTYITVSLAPTFFAAAGSIQLVVSNPGTPVVQSNAATITVVLPTRSFMQLPTMHRPEVRTPRSQ